MQDKLITIHSIDIHIDTKRHLKSYTISRFQVSLYPYCIITAKPRQSPKGRDGEECGKK